MDEKFHPAMSAIESGNLNRLIELIQKDPALATDPSSEGHPSLLHFLTTDVKHIANKIKLADVLINAGSNLDAPLVAASQVNNVDIAEMLVAAGAAINGHGDWSPIEEALYWMSPEMVELLLQYGATVHNLRIASGLGRVDLIETFFNSDGTLKVEAGVVCWPFDEIPSILKPRDPQNIINNAFIYGCQHGYLDVVETLLLKGAEINAIPPGFHFPRTGLHSAALNGHLSMVEYLVGQGGDVDLRDRKVKMRASDWAAHAGHMSVTSYLRSLETFEKPILE